MNKNILLIKFIYLELIKHILFNQEQKKELKKRKKSRFKKHAKKYIELKNKINFKQVNIYLKYTFPEKKYFPIVLKQDHEKNKLIIKKPAIKSQKKEYKCNNEQVLKQDYEKNSYDFNAIEFRKKLNLADKFIEKNKKNDHSWYNYVYFKDNKIISTDSRNLFIQDNTFFQVNKTFKLHYKELKKLSKLLKKGMLSSLETDKQLIFMSGSEVIFNCQLHEVDNRFNKDFLDEIPKIIGREKKHTMLINSDSLKPCLKIIKSAGKNNEINIDYKDNTLNIDTDIQYQEFVKMTIKDALCDVDFNFKMHVKNLYYTYYLGSEQTWEFNTISDHFINITDNNGNFLLIQRNKEQKND